MAVPNTNNLETTTLRLLRRRMADNIFKANPTAAYFLMNGRVKTASGGRYISEPLMYTTNQTVQAYRGYDRLNVAPTEELTEAQYNWRLGAVSIAISGEEELINSGPEAIFDLLKAKIKVADMSLRQWFDEKIHGATENKDTTKDILGLDEIIDDDDAAWSTLGGIDASSETWWRNQLGPGTPTTAAAMPGGTGVGDSPDPVHITATSTTELTALLNRMYHNCAKGSADTPDLILTGQEVYERYENDALDKRRLMDNAMADLGFENIKFKGARIMWNENIQNPGSDLHPIYFVNSEYMSFTIHSKRNFVTSSFVSPWDQDAKVAQIMFAGNMTCSNRRRLGVTWVDLSP